MKFKPTDEQIFALDLFSKRESLKISAFAGAGKTSSLILLSESRLANGLYLAFNKSIAAEAAAEFPITVDCKTTHSLAWRWVSKEYRFSVEKMSGDQFPAQLQRMFQMPYFSFKSEIRLSGFQQAFLILQCIKKFCQSSDVTLLEKHVPRTYERFRSISENCFKAIVGAILDGAQKTWKAMVDPKSALPLGHDGYLKLWTMGDPRLEQDFVMLDEAQDSNEALLAVLRRQNAQIVYVGDRHQQIYAWRGAVNAMESITGCSEAYLTQSFRFGERIADVATQIIRTLGEKNRIKGNPEIKSKIVAGHDPEVVLARTNSALFEELIFAINKGKRPHLVGNYDDLKHLIQGIISLKCNEPTTCPDLFGFRKWSEVVDHSETEERHDLKRVVQLVRDHGELKLKRILERGLYDDTLADVTLSTAHKAKGCEWDSVRLASDFLDCCKHPENQDKQSEARLFYVAATRARKTLSVEAEIMETFSSGDWKDL